MAKLGLFVLAAGLLFAPLLYSQEAQKPARWYDDIATDVFISSAYSYNFNNPDSMKNNFHAFDFDNGSMKIDVMELVMRKGAAKPGETGFRFDLTAGSSIPRGTRSSGLDIGDLDFHQMYFSYIAPLGKGVRFDAGKFITSAGYETIEGYDAFNDNYTRSFLFVYAIPFTHTGVKMSYPLLDNVSATLMVANGWDNATDNNKSKTLGGQVAVSALRRTNLIVNYMFGPEKPNNNSDNRSLLDIVASDTISDMLTLGANADLGSEEHSAFTGGTAAWRGLAGYLRLNCSNMFAFSMRGEVFADVDGIRTGMIQNLRELTFTPEYRPVEHIILRADLRYDISDQNVFQKNAGSSGTQTTLGINAMYAF